MTPATHGAESEQCDNEKRIALALSAGPNSVTSADGGDRSTAWQHSVPDVLASTANLLKTNGWRAGAPFGEGPRRGHARVEPVGGVPQDHGAFCREADEPLRRSLPVRRVRAGSRW
jgi:hypothetical protein